MGGRWGGNIKGRRSKSATHVKDWNRTLGRMVPNLTPLGRSPPNIVKAQRTIAPPLVEGLPA